MTIAELRSQYAKLQNDAKAVIDGAEKITSEVRTKYEAMLAEAADVAAVITHMEAEERTALETRGKQMQLPQVGEHAPNKADAETRSKEIRNSFQNWMASGAVETRDITGSATSVLVPQLFDSSIFKAMKSYGQLVNMVNIMNTPDQKPMKLVYSNDTANGLTAVTAGTDAAEVDPSTSSATLACDNLTTGVVRVSLDVLNSAGFDVDGWIQDQFAERYFRGLSSLLYAGNAGNIAALSTYTTGITTAAVGTLAFKDLVSLAAALDPAYAPNATFACNNSTLYAIAGMVDTNNRPLFLPYNDGGASGFAGTILGHKVMLVTQMPNVATNNYPVLFGDFKKGYTCRVVGGGLHTIGRMTERYLPAYEIGFVGFASIGGVVTNYGATPIVAAKIQ